MKRTEKTTAKHLSFSASSLHFLQRNAFVLPSCIGRWRNISVGMLLAASLTLSFSVKAQSNNSATNRTAISTKGIGNEDNPQKYSMPSVYQDKLTKFIQEWKKLFYVKIDDVPASKYTVDFVNKEMQSDWGISKDNQLLFIWHCVHGVITGKDLYDGEDGDSKRLEEFKKVLDNMDACENRYKEGIMPFAEKLFAEYDRRSAEADRRSAEYDRRSAEADRRSAEADRRSAEARKETMKADSLGIREMVKYYNLCIKNPATNDRNEMQAVISAARDIIQNCKEFGIDCRAIILKEVSDRRKVDEILKFYGVE